MPLKLFLVYMMGALKEKAVCFTWYEISMNNIFKVTRCVKWDNFLIQEWEVGCKFLSLGEIIHSHIQTVYRKIGVTVGYKNIMSSEKLVSNRITERRWMYRGRLISMSYRCPKYLLLNHETEIYIWTYKGLVFYPNLM